MRIVLNIESTAEGWIASFQSLQGDAAEDRIVFLGGDGYVRSAELTIIGEWEIGGL